ncbi:MAG: hypothetical protein PHS44_07325, partial [Candidatus Dojkabacteria bacterium]|nr:hypothetical protein [Candidatus Dojkabacteria bacterium]
MEDLVLTIDDLPEVHHQDQTLDEASKIAYVIIERILSQNEYLPLVYGHAFEFGRLVTEHLLAMGLRQVVCYAAGIAAIIIDIPLEERAEIIEYLEDHSEFHTSPIYGRVVRILSNVEILERHTLRNHPTVDLEFSPMFVLHELRNLADKIGATTQLQAAIRRSWHEPELTPEIQEALEITIAIVEIACTQLDRSIELRDHPEHFTSFQLRDLIRRDEVSTPLAAYCYGTIWRLSGYIASYAESLPFSAMLAAASDRVFEKVVELMNPQLRAVTLQRYHEYLGPEWVAQHKPANLEDTLELALGETYETAILIAELMNTFLRTQLTPDTVDRMKAEGTVNQRFHSKEVVDVEIYAEDIRGKAGQTLEWKVKRRREGDTPGPDRLIMTDSLAQQFRRDGIPYSAKDGTVVPDILQIALILPPGLAFSRRFYRRDHIPEDSIDPFYEQLFQYIFNETAGRLELIFVDGKHLLNKNFHWLQGVVWDHKLKRVFELRLYRADQAKKSRSTHLWDKQAFAALINSLMEAQHLMQRLLPADPSSSPLAIVTGGKHNRARWALKPAIENGDTPPIVLDAAMTTGGFADWLETQRPNFEQLTQPLTDDTSTLAASVTPHTGN